MTYFEIVVIRSSLTLVNIDCYRDVKNTAYITQQTTIVTISIILLSVPCGKGSMLYTDYCKKCDIGFYQNMEGQTLCFQCPKGRTTLGIGSNATDDCSGIKLWKHSFSHVYFFQHDFVNPPPRSRMGVKGMPFVC